jgi:hypothetical protein
LPKKYSLSSFVALLLALFIVIVRLRIDFHAVISWDIFGYYIFLPARFIYHDLRLENFQWVQNIFAHYHPSDTLYQLNDLGNGAHISRYPVGPAFLSLPFFCLAHFFTKLSGLYPADGFSLPYQYGYALGALFYTLLGLYFARKLLLRFFDEKISSLLLIIIVLGTNYIQLATEKNTLTHNYLFTLYAIFLYYVEKWFREPKRSFAFIIGITGGLIGITRPNEILILLVPLLWGVYNKASLQARVKELSIRRTDVLVIILAIIIGLLPQLICWKLITGHWLYYSYINPAEGFDLLEPHTLPFLFSFRKGWFIYTPLMLLIIPGFYSLYRHNRKIFWSLFLFTIVNLYIVSSWTCWWYAGGSYSSRSEVSNYGLLAIPIGYFLRDVLKMRYLKIVIFILIACAVSLNLFQFRQAFLGVLDGDRMTAAFYFRTFGKLSATDDDRKLLMLERPASGIEKMENEENYLKKNIGVFNYDKFSPDDSGRYSKVFAHSGIFSFKMDSLTTYSPGMDIKYKDLTSKDYFWLKAKAWIFIPAANSDKNIPRLVASFHHQSLPYKFIATSDTLKLQRGKWQMLNLEYLSPEVRSKRDNLKVFLWYTGKQAVYVDDLTIDKFEPKE